MGTSIGRSVAEARGVSLDAFPNQAHGATLRFSVAIEAAGPG